MHVLERRVFLFRRANGEQPEGLKSVVGRKGVFELFERLVGVLDFDPQRIEFGLEVRQKVEVRLAGGAVARQFLANLADSRVPFVHFIGQTSQSRKC